MHETNREKEIFEAALELDSPEQREAYVRAACGDNAELQARVLALLQANATATAFLPGDPPPRLVTEGPGTVIDRYRLLEQIGEGGFGIVYLAEQAVPVRRRVALKIIKPGMDTRQVIARFEAERQALALMDHPNIAQVFDGGVVGQPTDRPEMCPPGATNEDVSGADRAMHRSTLPTHAGRPYFVMELVRGTPITEFCDEQRLDTPARLKLFMDVCSAVQHAHQKGIIHRDLKPSNILVTLQGDRAVPKVIDFGIAKATLQPLTDKTLFTQLQQIIGTPAYMSPEQASFSGLDIDTRSDIYSLGVLLYELLTGRTPFDTKALLHAGLEELRRVIREEDPPKPSTRVGTLAEADRTSIARRRQLDARRLGTTLRGELDWIVMKALEKDRTLRYETANGLAMDLRRFLEGEPVLAGPPTVRYRIRKLVRRHRHAVVAGAVVAFALLATTVLSVLAAIEQTRLRAAAEDARQEAERQARRAEGIRDYILRDLLSAAQPERRGHDTKVVDLLRDAATLVSARFPDDPQMQTDIREVLAPTFVRLGLFDEALAECRLAVEFWRSGPNSTSRRALQAKHLYADTLLASGRPGDAIELAATTLEQARLLPERDALLELRLRTTLGGALHSARRFEEAEPILRDVVAELRAFEPPRLGDLFPAMSQYVTALNLVGKPAEAVEVAQEWRQLALEHYGPLHPSTLYSLTSLSSLLTRLGREEEAAAIGKELVAAVGSVFPESHPLQSIALQSTGRSLMRLGRFEEAEDHLLRGFQAAAIANGEFHYATEQAANRVADLYEAWSRPEERKHWLIRSFMIRLATAGPTEQESVAQVVRAGEELLAQTEGGLAAEVRRTRDRLAADNPHLARLNANTARGLAANGHPAEAEPFLHAAVAGLEFAQSAHEVRAILQATFPQVLEALGKPSDAGNWLNRLAAPAPNAAAEP